MRNPAPPRPPGCFSSSTRPGSGLVKDHGAKYGLGALAGAINIAPDGRYHAASDADRQTILALKKDPQISALMAGEYARSAQGAMEASLGRPVCGGELYAAHFLGADAACKLIRASQSAPPPARRNLSPGRRAPTATSSFMPTARAKSVREVYDWAMQQPGSHGALASARLMVGAESGRRQARRRARGGCEYRDLAGGGDELAAQELLRREGSRPVLRLGTARSVFVGAERALVRGASCPMSRPHGLPVLRTAPAPRLLDMSITLSR